MLAASLEYTPVSVSHKQMLHYGQVIKSGKFRQFDYKTERNLKVYDQATPPMYNLANVRTKMQLFYGTNDMLVTQEVDLHFRCNFYHDLIQLNLFRIQLS